MLSKLSPCHRISLITLPQLDDDDSTAVHVKLADYGISRPTLPTGAKGFGGTEGFMAPEIVRYDSTRLFK